MRNAQAGKRSDGLRWGFRRRSPLPGDRAPGISSALLVAALALTFFSPSGGCGGVSQQLGGIGADCATDNDCETGTFCHEAGVCVAGCASNEQCGADEWCSASRCLPLAAIDQCAPDCAAGEDCVAGQCVPVECASSIDCPSGFACNSGQCRQAECTADAECPSRGVCDDGLCVQVECRENAECGPNAICGSFKCMAVRQCVLDQHCRAGQACRDGVCVGEAVNAHSVWIPCSISADCGWKQHCVDHACRHAVECTLHAHCPAGEPCFKGSCWPE